MTEVFKNRLKELEELTEYINKVEKETTMLLQSLNWDKKHLQKKNILSTCPIEDGHRLPESKLGVHLVKCKLQSEGYSKDEILLPDLPVDANSPSVVKFSSPAEVSSIIHTILNTGFTKERLPDERPIPQSIGRIQTTYTQDERRALHDYVASKAHAETNVDELHMFGEPSDKQSDETKSYLKLLAEKRDSKRRRTKYKKVSTKSKSHTEVLREVIKNQMEVFIEVAHEQVPVKDNIETTKSPNANYSTRDSGSQDVEINLQKSEGRFDSYRSKRSKDHRKYDDFSDDSTNGKNSSNKRHDKYQKDRKDKKRKYDMQVDERDQRRYREIEKSYDKDNKRCKRNYYCEGSHKKKSEDRKDRHDRYGGDTYNDDIDIKRKYDERESVFEIHHHRASKQKKKKRESYQRHKDRSVSFER